MSGNQFGWKTALALVACLLAAATLSAPDARATILYVDAGAAPGGDGTSENPYSTIQDAIDNALALDTISVRPGTYMENLIVTKSLKLIGTDPVTTIIQGTSKAFKITGEFTTGENIVEIAGFTITNGSTAGIFLESSSAVAYVHNNIISYNGHGFYCTANGNGVLSNNVMAHNATYAILVENGASPAVKVYNNIFVANYAIYDANNYNYGNIICYNNNWNGQSVESIDVNIGNISLDPQFTDVDSGDYTLTAASPSIDAGRKTAADNDPDGTRNDQGVYGGPGAAAFWPGSAGGPVVTEFSVTPPSVATDGTITIRAKAVVP